MAADLDAARRGLDLLAAGPSGVHLHACVRCGLCGPSCPVWRAEPEPQNLPGVKLETLARLARRRHTFLGRFLPAISGAAEVDEDALADLVEAAFGRCTGCGRCGLHCAVGVDVGGTMRQARRILARAGLTPPGLASVVKNQLETGNQMAIPAQELRDTAAWLAEELARESGRADASLPIDREGSRILYLVNPREVKFFPLSLQAAAGAFLAAGESWTLSSRTFDVTNYGFFAGDDEAAEELTRRVFEEAKRLRVEEIVLSECGHGFRSFRWEGPEWTRGPAPVPMRSVLELMDGWLEAGRIPVDPSRNPLPTTLHDPCNLVRWGGVVEPQRRILARTVQGFTEMTPHGTDAFCCGGGGGLLSLEEYGPRRLAIGGQKAAQIRATGARVVACPCHNCADQLLELVRVHGLDVEIRSVTEILYDAIVWS